MAWLSSLEPLIAICGEVEERRRARAELAAARPDAGYKYQLFNAQQGAAPKASYQEEFEAHEAAAAAAAGAPEAFDTSAIDAMLYAKDPSRR